MGTSSFHSSETTLCLAEGPEFESPMSLMGRRPPPAWAFYASPLPHPQPQPERSSTSRLQESLCGYTIILMAIFWCTEALPLAITSLFPVILFPLMGVMDSTEVRSREQRHRAVGLAVE